MFHSVKDSRDGISLSASINIRFRLKREAMPQLHQSIGPNHVQALVGPEVGNRMREVIPEYTAEDFYSTKRAHFIGGSLASLNHTRRDILPTLTATLTTIVLTTAACSGLRPEPDCRPRRTYLHLSYSCASPFGPAILVTHDPTQTSLHL